MDEDERKKSANDKKKELNLAAKKVKFDDNVEEAYQE